MAQAARSVVCARTPRRAAAGLTFVELLVTLVILSVLAMAALPYAELTVRRERELELRQTLREMRGAIDTFHEDWRAGRIAPTSEAASADGYPRTLQVLVDGVDHGRAAGGKRRYLRRIPRDPMVDSSSAPATSPWVLRGYQDSPDAPVWSRRDVYDIRSASPGQAIDGSYYRDW